MKFKLRHLKLLLALSFFYFIFFNAYSLDYKEIGNSLDKEGTSFSNFSERFKFARESLSILLNRKQDYSRNLNAFLKKLKFIYTHGYSTAAQKGNLNEESFKYFDITLYNIIYVVDKIQKGRELKYFKPIIQPRLTDEFISAIKGSTYKNNINYRGFFIVDFSMSTLFENLGAYEKKAVKEFIFKFKNYRKLLRSKNRGKLLEIYKMTDSALKIIKPYVSNFDQMALMERLFDFKIKSTVKAKPKKTPKKPLIPVESEKKEDYKKDVPSEMKLSFSINSVLLIIALVLIFFLIIIILKKNLTPTPSENVQAIARKEEESTKTPFLEFSEEEQQISSSLTKFDAITQMIVSTLPSRYEKIWKISKGGMGVVFGAEDKFLRRKVAIKMISPSLCDDKDILQRFVNEARSIASLDHPNIMKIYDVGGEEYPYFVMEYLNGLSLEDLVNKKKKLSQEELKYYGVQMADAFRYCHERGIIHRDIKPANIIVVDNFKRVKVVDFGIAKDHSLTGLTQANVTVGSPQYMAPEQIKGNQYGLYSDIYGFGVTLYKMASGKLPFDDSNIMSKITVNPFPLIKNEPGINKLLSALIMKCIDIDPVKRFQNFDQIRTVILKVKI